MWYVKLKYLLINTFNHAFRNLRWIVCWDFDGSVRDGSEFTSIEETDVRRLKIQRDDSGQMIYFLDNPTTAVKIQVIRLREFVKVKLGIEFAQEVP